MPLSINRAAASCRHREPFVSHARRNSPGVDPISASTANAWALCSESCSLRSAFSVCFSPVMVRSITRKSSL
ncbi:hypothetical protein [Nocardia wallacei]|uniref:hypothetical protein n=1 Tax=Nocardia wallacei TaxID=480035 RepID=UPI002458F51A|nr:hypothetical protein [Nocardia wallacei]